MKRLLTIAAISAIAVAARAQNTTYGNSNAPVVIDGGYFSDYSPDGTTVLAGGHVSLSGSATYEHGNNLFQNDGTWSSGTNSLDLFLSTGSDTIGGSSAPSFFNVHFNNGAGNIMAITNTQGIHIAGQAQFSNGITTTVRSNTNIGAIHFADGAAYTGANTDAQHINGYVSKTGNDAFTFPLGSGTDLRTLSISGPASSTTEISAAWFAGDPGVVADPSDGSTHSSTSVSASIQAVSTSGFWDWIPVAGSDDGITVTVSMPDMTGFANASDLRLVGWDGTEWIDLSGSATATGNTENSSLSGTIPTGSNITAISIGSVSTPLPILFSGFEVANEDCKALLNWHTAMEQNNDYFSVERSQDGRNFQVIGKVEAVGNSNETQNYHFVDAYPLIGSNYYRIVQIDLNGSRHSSVIKHLDFDCNNKGFIKVYPTITKGLLYVDMPKGYEQAKISMVDMNGRRVIADIPTAGLNRRLRISSVAAGVYFLRIEHNSEVEAFKIVYQP